MASPQNLDDPTVAFNLVIIYYLLQTVVLHNIIVVSILLKILPTFYKLNPFCHVQVTNCIFTGVFICHVNILIFYV